MFARFFKKVAESLYPPFQLACYGLVWASFGYITWTLVKNMVGDGFVDSLSSVITL